MAVPGTWLYRLPVATAFARCARGLPAALEVRFAPHSALRPAIPVRYAGHSKWAKIHRAKGANDAKRAILFSMVASSIKAAVQAGGKDPALNMRLQGALDRAKEVNVPKDVVDRALEAGATSAAAEQVLYEGRGPANSGILVEALTDNRKRTTSAVRSLLTKSGGELQSSGKVSYDFDYHGRVGIVRKASDAAAAEPWEDRLLEAALGAGALDVEFSEADADDTAAAFVVCEALAVYKVRDALAAAGFEAASTAQARLPRSVVTLEAGSDAAVAFESLIDALEEHPDVERVFHNVEVEDGEGEEEEGASA